MTTQSQIDGNDIINALREQRDNALNAHALLAAENASLKRALTAMSAGHDDLKSKVEKLESQARAIPLGEGAISAIEGAPVDGAPPLVDPAVAHQTVELSKAALAESSSA